MITTFSPITKGIINRISAMHSRAFYDNPLVIHIAPNEAQRRHLDEWFAVGIRYGMLYGEAYMTPNAEGAAIWDVPGHRLNPIGLLRTGIYKIPFILGLNGFKRMLSSIQAKDILRRRNAPAQHWYLAFLAVDPQFQQQGIGSALLQPILDRADSEKTACYLETANGRNVPFYERHGFKVITDEHLPDGPQCWTMLREPQ